MRKACAWLVVALAVTAGGCAKKGSDQAGGGSDAGGDLKARPGMVAVPGDSIPRGPWMWVGTVGPADTTVCPDPARYTVTFLPDSTARLLLFCNRGSGSYHVTGNSIRIGPVATTRMACPPPTFDTEFGQQIEAARAWSVRGDTLMMDLLPGAGTMHFVR